MSTCTKTDNFLEILQREGLGGYLQFKKYVADFSPFDHEKQMLTLFMKTLDKLNHRLCFQDKENLSELILPQLLILSSIFCYTRKHVKRNQV